MDSQKKKQERIRLGDLLIQEKIITPAQLDEALAIQKTRDVKLGRILIDNGAITENQLLTFLATQLHLEYIDLKKYPVDPETIRLIPEIRARRLRTIALKQDEQTLLVGMADPTDIFAFDEIARSIDMPVQIAIVSEHDLIRVCDTVYRQTEEIKSFARELDHQLSTEEQNNIAVLPTVQGSQDSPVFKLLNSMFEDAARINASDIHIEPDEDELRIRFRTDGVLHVQTQSHPRIAGALLSRLKLMANLDISEKRLPQDGHFNITVRGKKIEVRLSTMPLAHGESAVMRLLNQSTGVISLDKVGMPPPMLASFRQLIHRPNGIILVVGPTGSGKTTTLYSALNEVNDPGVKIITAEDPVEHHMAGLTQVQVNSKVGLDFTRILRSVLRQDPDIVLVGEMRDRETVEIGLRAAMTGHLVFSTLHTNNAVATITRLIDMGAPNYLIASALRGIVAQRLVRRICDNCATPVAVDTHARTLIGNILGSAANPAELKKGTGCTYCHQTGYQGRIGIFEYLEITPDLFQAIHKNDLLNLDRLARQQTGYKSLKVSAVELAVQGLTTMEEVERICLGVDG